MRTVTEEYDVVVAGGGLAGFSAAIVAARHGARTVLIQDRPVLGGNSSSEVRVTPHGAAAFHGYARETGVVSEALVQDRVVNHATIQEDGWTNSVWDMVLYDMAVRTDGLTLELNTGVEQATTEDGRITRIVARTWGAELIHNICARAFIDCTGDGTLGELAGNPSRQGMEAGSEFDETYAPDEATSGTMGTTLCFKTVDTGASAEFHAPQWAVRYDDEQFFSKGGRRIPTLECGYWWIELGAPWDTLYDNETLRHELTRHVLGIWDYLKNRHPYWAPRATNLALDWVGQVPGKRESRRLEGRHVLSEKDLVANPAFDDEVAYGGWYMDLHTVGGLLKDVAEPATDNQWSDPHTASMGAKYVGPFAIPLSCLTSKTLSNLFFAGRDISATHAALSAARVMGTCASMGQAAGTAAAINFTADNVGAAALANVADIQQTLLRDGAFLVHVANQDPDDLARTATITASSSAVVTGVGPSSQPNLGGVDYWHDYPLFPHTGNLERRAAQWIIRGAGQPLKTLGVPLANHGNTPITVTVHLYAVDSIWDYRSEPGQPLATTELTVPVGGPTWIDWSVNLPPASPDATNYVRLDIDAAPNVEWPISPAVQPGQIAAYEDRPEHYRRFGSGQTLSFHVSPAQRGYEPDQVISGEARPHRSTNEWRSDPADPLPAWLQLTWNSPQTISQVQVTFPGHLLREYHAYPPFFRDPQTLRDYEIQVATPEGWNTVVRVQGNTSTRAVHTLDAPVTTDRLRLIALSTNGDPSAGVYEIRAYRDPICTAPSYPDHNLTE